MQFQVPQFIEVEDKIFGPFTFRQFIYIGGGAGACYVIYRLLPALIAYPLMIALASFALALAFMQYNGRPFIDALENGFYFFIHPRLYLWSNARPAVQAQKKALQAPARNDVYIPKLSESHLHELAWSLDIKERLTSGSSTEDDRRERDVMAPIMTARDATRF